MLHATDIFMRRLSKAMALLAGGAFLLLGFFIVFDTLSRKLGGPFSGITDAVSSLVMVFGATWSLAYALSTDAHVKIDVLTGLYSPLMARLTLIMGLVATTMFASVLCWQAWAVTIKSWQRGSFLPLSLLEIPLAWPQALAGMGYAILVTQGVIILAVAVLKTGEKW